MAWDPIDNHLKQPPSEESLRGLPDPTPWADVLQYLIGAILVVFLVVDIIRGNW